MTITLTREEAQQVLDALMAWTGDAKFASADDAKAIETLRARFAQSEAMQSQPEPQPVAWAEEIIDDLHACYNTEMIKEMDSGDELIRLDMAIAAVEEAAERQTATPQHNKPVAWHFVPSIAYPQLNTAQREWQGLTNEEVADAYLSGTGFVLARENNTQQHLSRYDNICFARAIEAKLKEKNK